MKDYMPIAAIICSVASITVSIFDIKWLLKENSLIGDVLMVIGFCVLIARILLFGLGE